jgi:hypothetical protein
MNGAKNASRQTHCPGRPVYTSRAIASATSTSGIVLISVKTTVLPRVDHMVASPNASA